MLQSKKIVSCMWCMFTVTHKGQMKLVRISHICGGVEKFVKLKNWKILIINKMTAISRKQVFSLEKILLLSCTEGSVMKIPSQFMPRKWQFNRKLRFWVLYTVGLKNVVPRKTRLKLDAQRRKLLHRTLETCITFSIFGISPINF